MVQICINLAYIPDDVARKINFKPGWQKIFKKNMDEYKENFKKNHGKAWEFQNQRLEEDYIQFMYQQEEIDPEAITDNIDDKYKKFLDISMQIKQKHLFNSGMHSINA